MAVRGPIRNWETRGRHLAYRVARRLGRRLGPSLASTGIATRLRDLGSPMTILSTLDEVDEKLREVEAAGAISDDKMREVFQTFRMTPPTDLPKDPYSPEYTERQFKLYRVISGRSTYEIDHERSDFTVDPNRPFPYYTESPETVGHQLMAIGIIIKTMALSAGSSILELGPGWGNTTVALARMGYDVTAIDIDPTFVELISARAQKVALNIDVRQGGFLEIDQLGRTFDAVLFYECFHHCSDHRDLVRKLAKVLAPEGKVFFASEPIDDSFGMPWGLRLDGESLWAIRRHNWLELGYQESYFIRMMQHLGWSVSKHVIPASHLGVIYEARRAGGSYTMTTFRLPPDEDATWALLDSHEVTGQRYSGGRSLLSLEQGLAVSSIRIEGVNTCPQPVSYRFGHGHHSVAGSAAPGQPFAVSVPYDPEGYQLEIKATTWRPSDFMRSKDARKIGLGIRTITLCDEGVAGHV